MYFICKFYVILSFLLCEVCRWVGGWGVLIVERVEEGIRGFALIIILDI